MIRFAVYVMMISIIGCNKLDGERSVSFTIVNKSDNVIEKVDLYAGAVFTDRYLFSDSVSIVQQIIPEDSVSFIWTNPELHKSDGSFFIKVGSLLSGVGYYSNGIILEGYSKYTLRIYNDSIN